MAGLHIKDAEAHQMAAKLARRTGQTLTQAVKRALREALEREERRSDRGRVRRILAALGKRGAAAPRLDTRSADEIIGYDEIGVPR